MDGAAFCEARLAYRDEERRDAGSDDPTPDPAPVSAVTGVKAKGVNDDDDDPDEEEALVDNPTPMNILPPMVFDVATVKCERKLGRDESEKAAEDHRRDFNEAVLGKRQNDIFLIGLALHQKEQQLPSSRCRNTIFQLSTRSKICILFDNSLQDCSKVKHRAKIASFT